MKTPSIVGAAFILVAAATSVSAHHSFAAEYDQSKPVVLKGTLTKVEMTNPHGWIHLDVKDANAKVVNWAVETGPTNTLLRAGIRRTDFALGSEIVVEGFLAKNGTPTANGREIKFADGRKFFMGSSGAGAPTESGSTR
jgi:hypothetical protein